MTRYFDSLIAIQTAENQILKST